MNQGQRGRGPECTAFICNVTSVHQGAALHSREGEKEEEGRRKSEKSIRFKNRPIKTH